MGGVSQRGISTALTWSQARHVASHAATTLPPVLARLGEAFGHPLAEPITRLVDDPPTDLADQSGYAVRGKGPWTLIDEPARLPGTCSRVSAGEPLPAGIIAVLTSEQTESERTRDGGVRVLGRDALTGLPDPAARPTADEGILRKGCWARSGEVLAQRPMGAPSSRVQLVSPAMVALAAASGHDTIAVVRPPSVETIIIGEALQSAGIPRAGRVRDALGDAVPAHVAALGARANPPIRALDDAQEIRTLIEDSNADLVITTGSTAVTSRAAMRGVLVDLGAHWLIDGIAMTPGGSLLLARLVDGRILACLPGDPASALAGLYTVIGPVIRSMRGLPQPELASAVLASAAVQQGRSQDTYLAPVTVLDHDGRSYATPLPTTGPAGLAGWANADAIAVIAPGTGYREDVVELLPTIGA